MADSEKSLVDSGRSINEKSKWIKEIQLNAESSPDSFWGTGLHLFDKKAMDQKCWKGDGGLRCNIYNKVHNELLSK